LNDVKITAKKNFDLTNIRLDFSRELALIGDMIKKDIRMGIKIRRTIDGGTMDPLHPFTIKQKGSASPLIDTGTMSKVIVKKSRKLVEVFPAKSRTKPIKGYPKGIAEIQQKGATIRVTEKMRSFLHTKGLHLSKSTKVIKIPPRPWFGVSNKILKDIPKMIRKRIQQEISRV